MPLRASLPVSKALRKTHSYLRLRHSRSMKTLSIQRPRPSMEMRMPASFNVVVKAKLVNCDPWSVLKMSGLPRSEEHTSELQSRENLVCRLLLEKKKLALALAEQRRPMIGPQQPG